MSSGDVQIDSGRDVHGIGWSVGTDHGALRVEIGAGLGILDGEQAEKFAEAVARAVTPRQRVKHGPDCGCTPCKNEPSYEARRA